MTLDIRHSNSDAASLSVGANAADRNSGFTLASAAAPVVVAQVTAPNAAADLARAALERAFNLPSVPHPPLPPAGLGARAAQLLGNVARLGLAFVAGRYLTSEGELNLAKDLGQIGRSVTMDDMRRASSAMDAMGWSGNGMGRDWSADQRTRFVTGAAELDRLRTSGRIGADLFQRSMNQLFQRLAQQGRTGGDVAGPPAPVERNRPPAPTPTPAPTPAPRPTPGVPPQTVAPPPPPTNEQILAQGLEAMIPSNGGQHNNNARYYLFQELQTAAARTGRSGDQLVHWLNGLGNSPELQRTLVTGAVEAYTRDVFGSAFPNVGAQDMKRFAGALYSRWHGDMQSGRRPGVGPQSGFAAQMEDLFRFGAQLTGSIRNEDGRNVPTGALVDVLARAGGAFEQFVPRASSNPPPASGGPDPEQPVVILGPDGRPLPPSAPEASTGGTNPPNQPPGGPPTTTGPGGNDNDDDNDNDRANEWQTLEAEMRDLLANRGEGFSR